MVNWFIENGSTLFVGLILLAIVVLIIRSQIKKSKAGVSPCGYKCAGCTSSGACHPHK